MKLKLFTVVTMWLFIGLIVAYGGEYKPYLAMGNCVYIYVMWMLINKKNPDSNWKHPFL